MRRSSGDDFIARRSGYARANISPQRSKIMSDKRAARDAPFPRGGSPSELTRRFEPAGWLKQQDLRG